jgi:hypothetical protein
MRAAQCSTTNSPYRHSNLDALNIAVLGQVRYGFSLKAIASRESTLLHQLESRYNLLSLFT